MGSAASTPLLAADVAPWHILDDEIEGTTVPVAIGDGNHVVELVADIRLDARLAVLSGVHVQGGGPNSMGTRGLRDLAR